VIREAIAAVVGGCDLSREEAAQAMAEIMSGDASSSQIGALATALRMKGEAVSELAGMAAAMRARALTVDAPEAAVDMCGTGGDGSGTFNISTAAALVVVAAGVPVAKHGNRAMSSRCGSADVLEALGVAVGLGPAECSRCLEETGMAFMFAPRFHPAMRHAAEPRREIGIRTVFNLLGPLANPAGVRAQVLGVAEAALAERMALALGALGCRRALVVHGHGSLDELSISGPTTVLELDAGCVQRYEVEPASLGLARGNLDALRVRTPEESAAAVLGVLGGEGGPRRDVVLLNAAAGLYVADGAPTLAAGVRLAAEAVDSGAALAKLEELAEVSQRLAKSE